eukprot:gene62284-85179_t
MAAVYPRLTLPYRGASMPTPLTTLSIRVLAALVIAGFAAAGLNAAQAAEPAAIDPIRTSATEVKIPTPEGTVDVAKLMAPGPLAEMSIGKDDAKVTIVEYMSMTCPHCA